LPNPSSTTLVTLAVAWPRSIAISPFSARRETWFTLQRVPPLLPRLFSWVVSLFWITYMEIYLFKYLVVIDRHTPSQLLYAWQLHAPVQKLGKQA
jgi:hypothetical protein